MKDKNECIRANKNESKTLSWKRKEDEK